MPKTSVDRCVREISPCRRRSCLSEIYLYITGSCNLNCRHCWIDPGFGPSDKHLPWSDLKQIVEQAMELGC